MTVLVRAPTSAIVCYTKLIGCERDAEISDVVKPSL
jgi:hypothetical protein